MKLRPDFFENRWLRASSNSSLNDPFENRLSDEYLIDMVMSLSVFKAKTRKEAENIIRNNTGEIDNVIYCYFSDYGVMSFTETKDNLLMWSHYAEQHQGMVIEFDPNHEFFTSSYLNQNNSHEGYLARVLYRKERLSEVNKYLMDVFVHKSDEWAYEKEHRMILNLAAANKKLILNKEERFISQYFSEEESANLKKCGDFRELSKYHGFSSHSGFLSQKEVLCMYELPKESIKSVIFGCNSNDLLIEESKEILTDYRNVSVYKSRIDNIDYRLRFDDISL